jgi:hypothetical protein
MTRSIAHQGERQHRRRDGRERSHAQRAGTEARVEAQLLLGTLDADQDIPGPVNQKTPRVGQSHALR